MKTCTDLCSYLAQFFSEWEILQTKVLKQIGTNFMFSLKDSYKLFKYGFVYTFRAEDSVRQQVPVNIWYPFTKNHERLIGKSFACTTRNRINFYKIQEHKLRNILIEHVEKYRERKLSKIFSDANHTDQETGKNHLDKCNWWERWGDFVICWWWQWWWWRRRRWWWW